MKPEYTEGPKALENFERGMTALFKCSRILLTAEDGTRHCVKY
jgi:exonuclease VII small subunit